MGTLKVSVCRLDNFLLGRTPISTCFGTNTVTKIMVLRIVIIAVTVMLVITAILDNEVPHCVFALEVVGSSRLQAWL